MLKNGILCGGVLTLTCLLAMASQANDKKGGIFRPKVPGTPSSGIIKKGPPAAKADLAAFDIASSVAFSDEGPTKEVAIGYVKNIGTASYTGSNRTATLYYKHNGFYETGWKIAVSGKVPHLKVGEIYQISTDPGHPATFKGAQLKLVVSAGDDQPGNDVFMRLVLNRPGPVAK